MSGSAALAAARRRRAPGLNTQVNVEEQKSVSVKKPVNVNPMVVLKTHDLFIKEMINDIAELKENNTSSQDISLNKEIKKVQHSCLETNLEMMNLKKQVNLLTEIINKRTNIIIDEDNTNLLEND